LSWGEIQNEAEELGSNCELVSEVRRNQRSCGVNLSLRVKLKSEEMGRGAWEQN